MKRLFDILTALTALCFLAVPFVVVILILRLTGEGNVWYRQERIGYKGKIFRVFKFVTMRVGSEFKGNKDITVRGDPRILPVGRILRMTKLNELPQVLNVLIGDMSIVGWRPLVPRGFYDYSEDIQRQIVQTKPGITGIGSIIFRDEEAIVTEAGEMGKDLHACYREDILPYKGTVEMWYGQHQNIWVDFKIILATAWAIIAPGGIDPRNWFNGLPEPDSALVRKHVFPTDRKQTAP
ncbi:MAG: sugar transferase [Phycisphaerales bacterium JB063]